MSNLSDGDDEFTAFLVESLSSLLCPRQFSAYGIDPRSLVITDTKAWHVYIDCVVWVPFAMRIDEDIIE
jgi:exosome complex RNA-binding protein Rrp42 (RNase PH superfamily)